MSATRPVQIVFTTVPDRDTGLRIADRLVEYKLAACVSLLPGLVSTYVWQGELQHEYECLLMIKTRAADYRALETALQDIHPYELPEIIAVPLSDGLPAYLNWITESLEKPE